MDLNPEIDLEVDIHNLTEEFRKLSLTLYRYTTKRAGVSAQRDLAKAKLKETRAMVYKRTKSDITKKHTENSLEAEIDTDPEVMDAHRKFIRAEHDASTWDGAVDSMKAKKDVLIQLGSDRRKEIGS
jgi:hypothetical protein